MGGGGSYSGPPSRTPEEGEKVFRTSVEEAEYGRRPRLFVSHAWEYSDQYRRLVNMLDKEQGFNYSNYSVPEHDPLHTKSKKELVDALYNQIRPTNVVIILAGMYVPYREWVQKEIDIAVEMGKPIIGIAPRGSQKMPKEVQDAATEIVGWNTQSIVTAIRKYAK